MNGRRNLETMKNMRGNRRKTKGYLENMSKLNDSYVFGLIMINVVFVQHKWCLINMQYEWKFPKP